MFSTMCRLEDRCQGGVGHRVELCEDLVMGDEFRLVSDYLLADAGELIANGAIDIDAAGRIVGVGTSADLGEPTGAVQAVGGLLMPGLVNAHAHTPMTLLRSAGDGMALQAWLTDAVWPREGLMTDEDAHWGMVLGSLEMLTNGVTTSCEMYFFEAALVDAVEQTGGRMVLTPGVVSALLPNGNVAPRIDELEALFERYHDPASRITMGFAPHSPYDLTADQVAQIAQQAQAVDALLHIHLEETEAERALVLERDGKSATQMLADIGALEGRVLAAHGVWLDETDQRLLAAADAAVAHCPMSNLKLGSGIAPVTDMIGNGLRVALGTDGVASNDNLDLWEELKLAPLLARGANHDPAALDAATALDMATRASATAVGLDDVGELRAGAWADIIRIDLDTPVFMPGREEDLLSHIVYQGSGSQVTDVWVAGEQVVADGTPTKVDIKQAQQEVRTRGHRLAEVS